MMLRMARVHYKTIVVKHQPLFPAVIINGKKIIRPSDTLKQLGMSLGYYERSMGGDCDELITSFV